ncbi:ABC transporter substrate-binding protein [Aeromicrobium alkaliterrae]|uniref:ABC transporter substrate-binding protein n=1 Tax=Aeromicrobium alkaliterrae TaxID=302168 RepID=A0ABP4VEK5_9ACTN
MTRRRTAIGAAALALLLAAAGCGSGSTSGSAPVDGTWDEVLAAANEEGEVLLYSTQHPENLAALKTAFEAEYPEITMEFVRGTDVEMTPRVETEQQTGRGEGDVHMLSDPRWALDAAASGTFSTEVVGPAFDQPAYDRASSVVEDRMFLTSGAVGVLAWNEDQVPEGLETPEDLLDERFRGKIGITDPAGFFAVVDQYLFLDENWAGGDEFLDELAELEPRVYPGSLAIAQALASGEISVTPMTHPLVREQATGAPVGWALPEQAWGTPWYSHVLQTAPHPNAAQVLANFMVTPAGQEALSTGYASVLPDTESAVYQAQDIATPNVEGLTPERIAEFQARWESLYR